MDAQLHQKLLEVSHTLDAVTTQTQVVFGLALEHVHEGWIWPPAFDAMPQIQDLGLRAATAWCRLEFGDEEERPQQSWIAPGGVAVSPRLFAELRTLNQLKQTFANAVAAVLALKHHTTFRGEKMDTVRAWLLQRQHGRVSRRYVTRQVHLLNAPPHKLSYSWTQTRTVARLSRAQTRVHIKERVANRPDECEQLLEQLQAVPDPWFAWARQIKQPHARARVTYANAQEAWEAGAHPGAEEPIRNWTLLPASIPIAWLAGPAGPAVTSPLPEVRELTRQYTPGKRLIPWLEGLHLYRYHPDFMPAVVAGVK